MGKFVVLVFENNYFIVNQEGPKSNDYQDVRNNIITNESITSEHSQQFINRVAFAHGNIRPEELNNAERRDVTPAEGPDSTCLEIGNTI